MNVPLRPPLSAVICFALALASLAAIPARAAEVTLTVTAVAKKGAPPPIKKKMCRFLKARNASSRGLAP